MRRDLPLVCIDLGRVLVRLPRDWKHACEVARVSVPAGLGNPSGAALAAIHEINSRYDTGQIDLPTFARELAPHTGGFTPEDLIRLQECYLLGAFPGVAELIDDVSRTGVRTACLSNTSDQHWRMMNDPDCPAYLPLDRLDYRFASHLLRLRKPNDAIYAHVEHTVRLPGERIVFFDDLLENIEPARRRGWRAHVIDTTMEDPTSQIRAVLKQHGVL